MANFITDICQSSTLMSYNPGLHSVVPRCCCNIHSWHLQFRDIDPFVEEHALINVISNLATHRSSHVSHSAAAIPEIKFKLHILMHQSELPTLPLPRCHEINHVSLSRAMFVASAVAN